QIWHILLLSFLTGSAQSFSGPAYASLLPLLVKREDVPNAVAMNSMQFNLARVIGPALGGVVYGLWGAAACFAFNGVSFIAVIIAMMKMKMPPLQRSADNTTGVFDEMREGFSFVRRRPTLQLLTFLAFAVLLIAFGLSTHLVISAIAAFFAGACVVGVVSLYSSLVQLAISDSMRGRVMSIFMLAFRGGMPLGALLAGAVIERSSLAVALSMNGV